MDIKTKEERKNENIEKIQELLSRCVEIGIDVQFVKDGSKRADRVDDDTTVYIDLSKSYDNIKHRLIKAIERYEDFCSLREKEKVILDYYMELINF